MVIEDVDWSCKNVEEYRDHCGRRLVTTIERDRTWHSRTWHSCPRYLVSAWRVLLLRGYGYGHESHAADNPLLRREWR